MAHRILRCTRDAPRSARVRFVIGLSQECIVTMSNAGTEELDYTTVRVEEQGAEGLVLREKAVRNVV